MVMITLQTEVFTPGSYEAAGSVILGGGQVVPYRSICQDHLFYNDDGKPIGSMFTYSYFRSDIEDAGNRPVVFVFNGGPGSGSLWLQAGMFGPMRVRYDDADAVNPPSLPPYRVENNEL
ncbi:hypothetical protein LJC64_05460 [Ruminococcaceae bacterium OttesenSCG-928-A11]|nr:hypothetical protein [Ruminococcaceae bacterium OttesenSCG-928-A11]